MNTPAGRFNIILALFFCALLGCKSTEEKQKDPKKQATLLRFHAEANPDPTGRTVEVSVFRSRPMLVTVQRDAALDEGYIKSAEIVDADEMGGFAIKITFDAPGTKRLEALTIQNRGLHVAINAVWTESRWLALPLITKRISDGVFIFTPDASREEVERIVTGLQNVSKKLQAPYTF